MENSKEPISLRLGRLYNSILTRCGPIQRNPRMKMSQDALLDAFILLYEECSKESLKRDPRVNNFINKYRTLLHEIKSLRVNLNDFEIHQVIGRGYFGEVKVVKEKQTNDFYAMKTIKKSETAFSTCTVLFEEERDIMCIATSIWITKLQYSFQDNDNLYFIMEYNAGGDLFSLLKKHNGRFSPETARFYLAETALAIRALHQMGYVHRDIKPENILLDSCGHVKLGDFGCAAKLSSVGWVTQTMPMGTPQYLAPEVMYSLEFGGGDKSKKQSYGMECDYWSLGIIAYEMVVGQIPFTANQLKTVYNYITKLRKQLKYPEGLMIPENLQTLILGLLDEQRCRLNHDGVIKHDFFRGINWANIRNEAPPIVPPPINENSCSSFIPEYPRKLLFRSEVKDCKKEFSGKNLPFIGFSYSNSIAAEKSLNNDGTDTNLDKKSPALESLLAVARRENKNLITKLFEAEFGKTNEVENLSKKLKEKMKLLDICEQERNNLQREVAKLRAEYSNLNRILDLERQDRREVESNALKLISDTKIRIQRDITNQMRLLNSTIEELNDKLTEAHTVNNELTSKNDRIKSELMIANKEIEILKKLEADFKNKLTEAREFKRKSVVGLESRLEKMANDNQTQANILQQKLNDEAAAKNDLEKKLKELETILLSKESQFKQDKNDLEDLITKLEIKINTQKSEIASLQAHLNEKPDLALLEDKLRLEKNECEKLRTKVSILEYELAHANRSFVNREEVLSHQEAVVVLENELREASEEKIRLQKKLQKTKETEEENRQKLSSLEVVVDRLEQGVLKLEAENAKLKQQVVEHAQPILPEAETRYQEKILILEDQIAKLENQLQKLRENSVLDKESLRTTQTALWKTEKELSDAKIDIRIAQREAKALENLIEKLHEDIKKLTDRLNEEEQENLKKVAAEREKFDKIFLEKADLKGVLNQKELEIKTLKSQLEEFEELKKVEKLLKKDYNELNQKYKLLEMQADDLKEEKEKTREVIQSLEMEKLKIESVMEELKHKICSLELNNQVLKETGAMLDEQLEDYDKFTATQTQKIEGLTKEKVALEKEMENIQNELRLCRQNLNEEKSLRIRAEQKAQFLEVEFSGKDEFLKKAISDLADRNALIENLKMELAKCEETIEVHEMELGLSQQKYKSLNDEFLWLKKETSSYLTNLYSLRESNYKLTQDLEEKNHVVEALQERIEELQNVISDLEAFHKQREIKDEATKQQQNKLISFLQEKLDDARKKKITVTDLIFGTRSKENLGVTSPPSKVEALRRCRGSSKNLLVSPNTKEAISELVKSPSSQSYFQRQSSMQRMYHNIPHRFKNQTVTRSGMCESCHSPITRGTQASSCTHCGIQAHPKCALTVPKTCGLPQGLVKHYAEAVVKNEQKTENTASVEGWIKMLNSKKVWEKRYARLDGNKILAYEHQPVDTQSSPILTLNLCPEDTQVMVAESIDPNEVPGTTKTNIPYIIKIVQIPTNTCWPQETHYLMILTSSDKPKWLSALNSVVMNSSALENTEKRQGTVIHTFPKETALNITCATPVSDKIILLGADEGLFSLKTFVSKAEPVQINGPTGIRQLELLPHIGVALMIGTPNRRLLLCDHRALVSNAEAASCTNPSITVKDVNHEVVDENCFMFAVSPNTDGSLYLTVATLNKLSLLKWCVKSSEFQKLKVMETFHRCNCALYTKHSVIVGCDKFFEIKLRNFFVKEFLDPSVKSLAFWKVGSFPLKIFEISKNEFLLCFNEFGVFVNEQGKKTQCDFKWSKVPCDFAFSKPYLYVVHSFSVEVIRVPYLESKSVEDSICTSSTSTISDSVHVNLNNPRYVGDAKVSGGIYLLVNTTSGVDLIILEGKKLYKDDLGSCGSLNSVFEEPSRGRPEGDEFSFTSSIVQSLDGIESSTPRHSDEESCSTYTISDTGNNLKRVTFVQEKAV